MSRCPMMAAMEKAVALDDSCDLTGVLASLPLASALPVGGRSGLTAIVALTTLTVRPQRTIIHLLSTLAVRPQHNCHTSVINIRRLFLTQLSYICYQHSPSVLNTVSYSCYEHFPSVLNTILLLYFFFLSTLHVCPPLTPYYAPIFVQHSPITFYSDLFQCSRRRPRLSKKCNRPGSESADKWTSRRVKGRLFERCD